MRMRSRWLGAPLISFLVLSLGSMTVAEGWTYRERAVFGTGVVLGFLGLFLLIVAVGDAIQRSDRDERY